MSPWICNDFLDLDNLDNLDHYTTDYDHHIDVDNDISGANSDRVYS